MIFQRFETLQVSNIMSAWGKLPRINYGEKDDHDF